MQLCSVKLEVRHILSTAFYCLSIKTMRPSICDLTGLFLNVEICIRPMTKAHSPTETSYIAIQQHKPPPNIQIARL